MVPPILMPTAPKYAPLAEWTRGQIAKFWPDHPEVFLCGTPEGDLPLRDDHRDWMRVVRSACADLKARGFTQTYVILDDHPPIARCNSEFLRDSMPRMSRELGATSIVTGGFGPLVRAKGRIGTWQGWRVECLPAHEPWKLPLHPALWNLERLTAILETLVRNLPEDQHTPWAFERIGSNAEKSGIPGEWLASCWRLDAMQTSRPEVAALHGPKDRLYRAGRRLVSAVARLAGQQITPEPLRHPRVGPYPCFWSGVMKKGKLNSEYLEYARLTGKPALTVGLREVFVACGT